VAIQKQKKGTILKFYCNRKKLVSELLLKVQKPEVCDATGDTMKNLSPGPQNPRFKFNLVQNLPALIFALQFLNCTAKSVQPKIIIK
jgi:hypothetical protein